MMWRRLLIVATLWPTLVDSNSNADSSSKKSKFPVLLEADTGAPKPGEGVGGVAVLLKPMPEATTMKTWSFLKESMLKIGDQVRQIMQVRNDMAMLQQDLTLQEKLWHQAELQLKQENAKLQGEVMGLQQTVKAGAHVKRDLMKVQQELEEELNRGVDLDNEAAMQEKKWQMEVKFLDARKNNVTALHVKVNDTASKEYSKAVAVQLQLQKDAVTLRLAMEDFQDRLHNGKEKMAFDDAKAKAQQAQLKQQIAAMQEGLKRIQGKLKPREVFDKEEAVLKGGLQKETDDIVELQAEHQQIFTQCTKEMQEQDAIKCSEDGKLRVRLAEKVQFCNAVQVQNEVLRQDLAKCGMLTGIGARPAQAPAMPSGLLPLVSPVPVRDEERLMMAAPAPAPVAYAQLQY